MAKNKRINHSREISKKEDKKELNVDMGSLIEIFDYSKNINNINENILELFPDIELAGRILTSAIIAPNDLITTNLNYTIKLPYLDPNTMTNVFKIVSETIDKEYNIKENLFKYINESLVTKGNYYELIIPYNEIKATLDNLYLNPSLESMDSIIFTNKEYTIELPIKDVIKITSNPSILKVDEVLSISNESLDISLDKELEDIFNNINTLDNNSEDLETKKEDVLILNNDNSIVGKHERPLNMTIPNESVIPITLESEPDVHIGYFILLNKHGRPLKDSKKWNKSDMDRLTELIKNDVYGIRDKAKSTIRNIDKKPPTISELNNIGYELLKDELKKAVNHYDKDLLVDIPNTDKVYSLILSRILEKKETKILYVPERYMINYVFEYKDNGQGKSLLEQISILASMRASLTMARLMSTINSSISRLIVNATIDDNDPDPEKTMKKIQAMVLANRKNVLPIGMINVRDLSEWISAAGITFKFDGRGIPNTKIDFETGESKFKEIDPELENDIRDRMINKMYLKPELVLSGFDPEFATTAIINNALLVKRIQQLQYIANNLITNHVRKICMNDGYIREVIRTTVETNIKDIVKRLTDTVKDRLKSKRVTKEYVVDWLTNKIIGNIYVELPTPDLTGTDNGIKEAFTEYIDILDQILDQTITSEALPSELAGDISDELLDTMKNGIKTTLIHRWLRKHNYLPEITDMFTLNEDGKPRFSVLDEYNDLVETMLISLKPSLRDNKRLKNKLNRIIEKFNQGNDEEQEDNNSEEVFTEGNSTQNDEGTEPTEDTTTTEEPMDTNQPEDTGA